MIDANRTGRLPSTSHGTISTGTGTAHLPRRRTGARQSHFEPAGRAGQRRSACSRTDLASYLLLTLAQESPSRDELKSTKDRKRLLLAGAVKFNEKPKSGVKMFEDNNLFDGSSPEARPGNLARFLATCPRLNKQLLGDYLSRPENLDILRAFMANFDFANVR